ncbi:hypothetical protein JQ615_36935 [Bradyrhizobium jicamae]|uniref:Uncharacterized protein n=1 Tax=Bradyrhizobium jicamae TaxID=280332 RepID=A0ABS5FVU1_9BRAD|nr:hypothetical protein [Bradyrhizobium jicamae]MBR0800960.1 hypothetical protein [Bradyrhizobium jicamae]
MKLVAGKHYRTRSGRRARVAAVDEDMAPGEQAVGWVEWSSCSWNMEGSFYADLTTNDLDLVEELGEPRRIRGWINIYPGIACDTAGPLHANKDTADKCSGIDRIACVEIDAGEGQGLD